MNGAALLDVNVLVALFDSDHVHHDLAHDWFADHRALGWATCPVTESGLIRVLCHPRYAASVGGVGAMLERLRKFRGSGGHVFWADGPSLTDGTVFSETFIGGHRQLTDVYLLGVACLHGGRLATFDRSIPLAAVAKARPTTLLVIGATADG